MSKKVYKVRRRKVTKTARRFTSTELRTVAFVATLTLAGVAIANKIDSPVVWTFLGMAIGSALGQPNNNVQ
jgi:hypothetical protein